MYLVIKSGEIDDVIIQFEILLTQYQKPTNNKF